MNDAFPQSVHEQAWEGICAELLATLPCDLEKAPSGPSAKIIEIGRLFARAAKLAAEHPSGSFFRASLVDRLIDDELRPYRKRVKDLTADGVERAEKRVTKAITVGMKALVYFGLFETTSAIGAYHLTDLGKKYLAVFTDRTEREAPALRQARLEAEAIRALSGSKQLSLKIEDLGADLVHFSSHSGAFPSQKSWKDNSDRPVTLHKK
jgi:hypothetical protein